jgi:hypothetical protein
MSPAEVSKLLPVLAAAYSNFVVDNLQHRLWSDMLADLDYRLAVLAVRRHIATSRFAPTIAEIREHAVALSTRGEVTGAEAWGELMQAIRHHGYYHEVEGLASLSPSTRRVAEMLTWREINLCENVDVLRGQFLRMYDQVRNREAREAMIPPELRQAAQWLLGDQPPAEEDGGPKTPRPSAQLAPG